MEKLVTRRAVVTQTIGVHYWPVIRLMASNKQHNALLEIDYETNIWHTWQGSVCSLIDIEYNIYTSTQTSRI